MLTPIEGLAHIAWVEYYTRLAARVAIPPGEGYTVHGSKYFKSFMAIADLCASNGYEVADYVGVALSMVQKDPRYIQPKDLLAPAIITLYKTDLMRRNNTNTSMTTWKLQEASLMQMRALRPDLYTDPYNALISPRCAFTAWFRVMYKYPIDPDIMETYGASAWGDLQQDAALRQLMYKLRPESMAKLQEACGYFGDTAPGVVPA